MEEPFVSRDTCLQITSQGENVVELTWQQENGNTNCEESEQKPRSRAIKWGAPSFLHAKNSQLFALSEMLPAWNLVLLLEMHFRTPKRRR